MPKEQYMCQLCANHGMFNQPKKGHKQKCPHRHCPCSLCALNTKRRRLDQMERQLRTSSDPTDGGTVSEGVDGGQSVKSELEEVLRHNYDQNGNTDDKHSFYHVQHLYGIHIEPSNDHKLVKMIDQRSKATATLPYTIPIKATMSKAEVKCLKKSGSKSSTSDQDRQRRTLLFEETLTRITASLTQSHHAQAQNNTTTSSRSRSNLDGDMKSDSIFKSVLLLAESES